MASVPVYSVNTLADMLFLGMSPYFDLVLWERAKKASGVPLTGTYNGPNTPTFGEEFHMGTWRGLEST